MILKLAFLLASCAVFAHCNPSKSKESLVYLGNVEGKDFYAEFTTAWTWSDAFQYCEQNGLKLAKLESQTQVDFVRRSLEAHPGYWVSAKPTGDEDEAYVWDSVGVHISEEILWTDDENAGHKGFCGSYSGGSLHRIDCTGIWLRTICQGIGNSTNSPSRSSRGVKAKAQFAKKVEGSKNGWMLLGDVEGKRFYHLDREVGWEEAFKLCNLAEMSLVRIETQVQANFLGERVRQDRKYWIASKDIDMNGHNRTWNSTGFYSRFDINWTDDGTVKGQASFCGAFIYKRPTGLTAKPRPDYARCVYDKHELICNKIL